MKTAGAAPSRLPNRYDSNWAPGSSDLKYYPHFDAPLRLAEIKALVNDQDRVAKNAFFPLIQYEKKWQPFRTPEDKPRPDKKNRKIRFAARRDAYIYAKYRKILYPLYEKELKSLGIDDIPIAYRKIENTDGKGKCNIEFSKDVFDFITQCDDCFVITLDISKFFESIDHQLILERWKNLLRVAKLPADHQAVFKSVTDYRWVDRTEVFKRLGYFGSITDKNGKKRDGYLKPYSEIPKQLCSPSEFREKVAGKGKQDSIINKNENKYGIPQGTPISDLIANFYMIDFDLSLKDIVEKYSGRAFRYSDDILLVIPSVTEKQAIRIEQSVRTSIDKFGSQLTIKESKSSIHHFYRDEDARMNFRHLSGAGKNGLEYLGFRFDGQRVYLRDSTLSNLKRKMTFAARITAKKHATRYPNRSATELIETYNFDNFFQTFMRVEEFDQSKSVKNWTFWTYARRASTVFGKQGAPIAKQLKWLRPDGKRHVIGYLVASR